MGNALEGNAQRLSDYLEVAEEKKKQALLSRNLPVPEPDENITIIREVLNRIRFKDRKRKRGINIKEEIDVLLKNATSDIKYGDSYAALASLNKAIIKLPESDSDLLCSTLTLRAETLLAVREFKASVRDAKRAMGLVKQEDIDLQARLKKLLSQCEVADDSESSSFFLANRNPLVPCTSDAMTLVDQRFRAARDIKPGEVLLMERPLVLWLDKPDDCYWCNHCFGQTLAPLPCVDCTKVVYCSDQCKNAGHQNDCCELEDYQPLYEKNAASSFLTLIQWISKAMELLDANPDPRLGVIRPLHCSDIDALLIRNSGFPLKTLDPGLQDMIKIFGLEQQLSKKKFEELVAILQQLEPCFKTAGCGLLRIVLNGGKRVDTVLGGGFFPTLGLATLSCMPNSVAFNVGLNFVLQSTRIILKGALVTSRLRGQDFTTVDRPKRWAFLREYGFLSAEEECTCEACVHDWPKLDGLESCSDEDDEVQRLLTPERLDGQLLPTALAKAEEMERKGLKCTKEFQVLQSRIRKYMICQGAVRRIETRCVKPAFKKVHKKVSGYKSA